MLQCLQVLLSSYIRVHGMSLPLNSIRFSISCLLSLSHECARVYRYMHVFVVKSHNTTGLLRM